MAKKIKRLARHCKKIFTIHIYNKGLVARIYKELWQLSHKKNKPPKKSKQNNLNWHITKDMNDKKHMKRTSTSSVISEIQIKITRCHYTPIRMTKFKIKNELFPDVCHSLRMNTGARADLKKRWLNSWTDDKFGVLAAHAHGDMPM